MDGNVRKELLGNMQYLEHRHYYYGDVQLIWSRFHNGGAATENA